MSQWICTKCGETASSKCPHQRSVFPADQMATALDSALAVHVVKLDRKTEAFFNLTIHEECSKLEAVEHLLRRLNVSDNTLKHTFCSHNWVRNSSILTDCTFECTHENLSNHKPAREEAGDTFQNVINYAAIISRTSLRLEFKTSEEKDASGELFNGLQRHIHDFFNSYEEERRKLTVEKIQKTLLHNDWTFSEQAFWIKETEKGLLMINETQIKMNDFEALQPLETFDLHALDYYDQYDAELCAEFFTLTKEQ